MSGSSGSSQGMQMYGGTGQNSRSGGSTFGQNVFNTDALNNLYGSAQNLFNQQTGTQQAMQPGAMDFSNQQAQGAANTNAGLQQGGVYGGLGIGNQLMDSLKQSQNTPSNTQAIYDQMMGQGNSYLGPLKASMEQNQANAQALNSGTNAAQAAASGMSGGSRQGVQDALMKTLGNQQLTSAENQMGYDTYDKTLQNRLGIAQQADANTLARQNLMSGMLGQQQNTVNQGIGNTAGIQQAGMNQFNVANQPYQGLQAYQGAIGAPTVLNQGNSFNQGQGTNTSWGAGQNSGSTKGGGLL
jgi:hypothetical protein